MTNDKNKTCLYCERNDAETPLVVLEYQGYIAAHLSAASAPADPRSRQTCRETSGAEGLSPADK